MSYQQWSSVAGTCVTATVTLSRLSVEQSWSTRLPELALADWDETRFAGMTKWMPLSIMKNLKVARSLTDLVQEWRGRCQVAHLKLGFSGTEGV